MNIFKDTCFSWWQISIFKFSVFGFGLLLGAYFAEWVWLYVWPIIIITVISTIYTTWVWLRQQRG